MIRNIIKVCHDEQAYCGIDKTVERIQANYFLRFERKFVIMWTNVLNALLRILPRIPEKVRFN